MTTFRFPIVVALTIVGVTSAFAQDDQRVVSQRTAWRIEGLTVMIDRGPTTLCSGAGIIVGHDVSRVYVLTAYHAVAGGDSAASIGVTARFSSQQVPTVEKPAEERRFDARVTQRAETADLALLVVTDDEFANHVRLNPAWNSLGDSSAVRTGDETYIVGCGSGFGWDSPAQTVPVLAPDTGAEIFFSGGYVRKGFSGGPLVRGGAIVGMTLGVGADQTGRAARIDALLTQARAWKVPIQLSAGRNDPGCTYTVSPREVVIPSGPDGRATISVRTLPDCAWGTSTPTINYAAQLTVTVPDDLANKWDVHFGSYDVVVTHAGTSSCQQRQLNVAVAGRLVRVTDSACTR